MVFDSDEEGSKHGPVPFGIMIAYRVVGYTCAIVICFLLYRMIKAYMDAGKRRGLIFTSDRDSYLYRQVPDEGPDLENDGGYRDSISIPTSPFPTLSTDLPDKPLPDRPLPDKPLPSLPAEGE